MIMIVKTKGYATMIFKNVPVNVPPKEIIKMWQKRIAQYYTKPPKCIYKMLYTADVSDAMIECRKSDNWLECD